MDPEHFDSIARTLSEDASRRHLLTRLSQGTVGAALAVLAGSGGEVNARNKNARKKRRDKKRRRQERDESSVAGSSVDSRATTYIHKSVRYTTVLPSKRSIFLAVSCPAGTMPLGAGFSFENGPRTLRLRGIFTGGIQLQHTGSTTLPVAVHTTCLRTSSGVSYTYNSPNQLVSPGTIGSVATSCPAGTFRMGGEGWSYSNVDKDFTLPVLANYPFDPGWSTIVDNRHAGATPETHVTTKVACATAQALGVRRPKLVAKRGVVVAAGQTLKTFVACPSGSEVASGGFLLPNSGAVLPVTSRPMTVSTNAGLIEGWEVSVLNRNTVSERFDAMAICLGRP